MDKRGHEEAYITKLERQGPIPYEDDFISRDEMYAHREESEEKEPRKSRVVFYLFLLFLFLLLLSPLFFWWLTPNSEWRVRVIDQTVPHPTYREHMGLFWALNHTKVPTPQGHSSWENHRDFVGYYPLGIKGFRRACGARLRRQDLIGMNMLFIADAYGVYELDYQEGDKYQTALDYSRKVYGGFRADEVKLIKEFANSGGSLIGEFNSFAAPTFGKERKELEKLFGVKWTRWAGRFFEDLSNMKEVPAWAKRHWKKHYNEEWHHSGPGYLLTHEDTRLFVLRVDKELKSKALELRIKEKEHPIMKGARDKIPFLYWFDINKIDPEDKEATSLAQYKLHLTPAGHKILQKFNVPDVFPAVVIKKISPLRIYFAGDISDIELAREPYFISGWPSIRRFFIRQPFHDQGTFFWQFYVPVMQNIFRMKPPKGFKFKMKEKVIQTAAEENATEKEKVTAEQPASRPVATSQPAARPIPNRPIRQFIVPSKPVITYQVPAPECPLKTDDNTSSN